MHSPVTLIGTFHWVGPLFALRTAELWLHGFHKLLVGPMLMYIPIKSLVKLASLLHFHLTTFHILSQKLLNKIVSYAISADNVTNSIIVTACMEDNLARQPSAVPVCSQCEKDSRQGQPTQCCWTRQYTWMCAQSLC